MKQTSNERLTKETHVQALGRLRAELAARGLDGFVVPRADEYLNEYVPESAERLKFLTGFTGSAGAAVVLPDRAAAFTDGRYTLQIEAEVDGEKFERINIIETPPDAWLRTAAKPGQRIGIDPWLHGGEARAKLEAAIRAAGAEPVLVDSNPLDAVWHERPPAPAAPASVHPETFAGQSSAAKRAELAQALEKDGVDAAIISATDSVAWLLNIRGRDVGFSPLLLASCILHADQRIELFTDPAKITPEVARHLGNAVSVAPREKLRDAVTALSGKRVRVDSERSPGWFADTLAAAGATVVPGMDPCVLPKARKNAVEIAGARAAQLRDGAALCRFLHWLDQVGPTGGETEISAAAQLTAFRAEQAHFVGESFPAIVGSGPNGAIIHYRATPATARKIRDGDILLCDSGAQYLDGTTDITRTVLIGTAPANVGEVAERFTRVLQGHIALATLRFPAGVAGPHIDVLARRALWDVGLDYDHGTGHGIGSFLGVHEGPAGISRAAKPVKLEPGMILSNEPGFYLPGQYGIRLENLLLVAESPGASKPFLAFETLSLAPFDRRLLVVGLLSPAEQAWLNAYHARVLAEVGPLLAGIELAWLERACAEV
jgi:Xaa-Pro aminopeptidase